MDGSYRSMSIDDENHDDMINERKPSLTDVVLPGEGYVLDHWTVPLGSAVRIGMTIAYARVKDNEDLSRGGTSSSIGSAPPPPTTSSSSSSSIGSSSATTASSTSTSTHKRPMRRRRPGGAAENIVLQKQLLEEQLANKLDVGKNLISQDDSSPLVSSFIISSSQSSSSSSAAVLGIRERLAAKLSTKHSDKTGESGSNTSDNTEPITGATVTNDTSNPIVTALSSQGKATHISSKKENIPILAAAAGLLRLINRINSAEVSLPNGHTRLAIGYIEECLHPTVLDGLCVVCGEHVTSKMRSSSSAPISSTLDTGNTHSGSSTANAGRGDTFAQLTVSGGVTMTVSQRESRQMALMDSERLFSQRRLALVLDLDHTLVHATSDPRAGQYLHNHPDVRTIRLPVTEGAPSPSEGGPPISTQHPPMSTYHYVKLRPHINEFLQSVQSLYEVTVYTAGTRLYAQEITMVLCRSMVGSTMECDDIEQLRYQVKMAEAEYTKHLGLQQQQQQEQVGAVGKGNSSCVVTDENNVNDDDKKRKADGTIPMDDDDDHNGVCDRERAKKRKKVSFGFQETGKDEIQPSTQRSDHMTRDTLETMQHQLREADDLEHKAMELRQVLFGSRVVSRTDVGDLGRDVKSLRRIFPCGGTMAAVVDDREDVWANAKDNTKGTLRGEPPDNLLLVRPYHWKRFVGFADINNAAGATLTPLTESISEHDQQLLWTRDILVRLHERYYQQSDDGTRMTVPETLVQMRKEVLQGSTVVFTGLPHQPQGPNSRASRPAIIRYAQNLGAKIQDNVELGVTHVVAARDGTDKWMAAKKIPGVALVKPGWLEESNWSMTNRDVEPFLIFRGVGDVTEWGTKQQYNNDTTTTTTGRLQSSESLNIENSSDGSSSNDTDDDNFAAELEGEFMDD